MLERQLVHILKHPSDYSRHMDFFETFCEWGGAVCKHPTYTASLEFVWRLSNPTVPRSCMKPLQFRDLSQSLGIELQQNCHVISGALCVAGVPPQLRGIASYEDKPLILRI